MTIYFLIPSGTTEVIGVKNGRTGKHGLGGAILLMTGYTARTNQKPMGPDNLGRGSTRGLVSRCVLHRRPDPDQEMIVGSDEPVAAEKKCTVGRRLRPVLENIMRPPKSVLLV